MSGYVQRSSGVNGVLGVIGFLAVLAIALAGTSPALATVHVVDQVSLTFSPDNLEVTVGDTVRWVYSSGIHTVTNGTGAADPEAGTLFDAPLNSANPVFEYVFDGPAGTYPYFCRLHESFGMTGQVIVTEETAVDDPPAIEPPFILEYYTWGRMKDVFDQEEE